MNHYFRAQTRLNGARSVKVATATYLIKLTSGDIVVRYHDTNVVTLHLDGTYTLDTGGWPTKTTRARIEEWAPVHILGRMRTSGAPTIVETDWIVQTRGYPCDPIEFENGLHLDVYGRPSDFSAGGVG